MRNAVELVDAGTDQRIEIKNQEYFHIKSVEVFTCGDDHGPETDGFVIAPRGKYKLSVASKRPGQIPGRLRGEPAVRLILQPENKIDAMELCIYHHKGSIYLRTSDLPHVPEEC